jgi:hypothetical protein
MQVLSLTSEAPDKNPVVVSHGLRICIGIQKKNQRKKLFIAQVLSSEAYDKNPVVESHDFFDWHGDLSTVLEHVLPSMQVGP